MDFLLPALLLLLIAIAAMPEIEEYEENKPLSDYRLCQEPHIYVRRDVGTPNEHLICGVCGFRVTND